MQIFEIVRVVLAHRNLYAAIQEIMAARKTGRLTVDFSQGGVSQIQWEQRGLQSNVWPFVQSLPVQKQKTCT